MPSSTTPISEIIASRLCTGCGGCAAASLNKIVMAETKDENHRPKNRGPKNDRLDASMGFASPAAVCPGKGSAPRAMSAGHPNKSKKEKYLHDAFGPILAVYEGHAADDEIRHQGSSGGAITAMGLAALELNIAKGVLHTKADPVNPDKSVATVSRSKAQLMQGAGSRYQPVAVLEPMAKADVMGQQTMIVGKPCDIDGAARLAVANPTIATAIAMKISILCAGTPSLEGTNQLIEALTPDDEPYRPALTGLSFRGKGWPGPMKATWRYVGGKEVSRETDYAEGWGSILQKFRQWRCHVCSDHTGELADISVGDPWHTPQSDGTKGRSLIIIRTERGHEFFKRACQEGYIEAEQVADNTIAKAQPNLIHAKASAWGRSAALKMIGLNAPDLRADGFRLWINLSLKAKIQSFAGTWKRVWQRKLYKPKSPSWNQAPSP